MKPHLRKMREQYTSLKDSVFQIYESIQALNTAALLRSSVVRDKVLRELREMEPFTRALQAHMTVALATPTLENLRRARQAVAAANQASRRMTEAEEEAERVPARRRSTCP